MNFGYARRTRGEILKYTRPSEITEVTDTGTIVYPPNTPRLRYDEWGRFLGMVFGDGGTATIPPQKNSHWVDKDSSFTLLAIGQAPVGVIWLQWGDVTIEGVGGHKLYMIESTDSSGLNDEIKLFPNKENIQDDCHVLLVKYYNETGIDFGEEEQSMIELNTFMNGVWS